MTDRLCIIIIFAIFSFVSTGVRGEVFVLGTASVEPFHNEQQTGVIDKLLAELFGRLGHQVNIVSEPAERALINANFGELDGDAFRVGGLSSQYKNLIQSKVSLYQIDFSAFLSAPMPEFNGLESLQAKQIGIVRGHKILEQKADGMRVSRVNSPEILFSMLDAGRLDVALINKDIGMAIVTEHPYPMISVLDPPIISRSMYFYLHKRHAELITQLDAVLLDMKQQGKIQ